ncbi:Mediator complex, subunit Med [Trema orientale]|uniref:Mediator of RNA polymerase II transcription subunit 13 n=1 Tax=Trema orientale TaxID=63057 RepID=A0A2P5FJT5_TREOI|nr:Mediator complex, subunit Med [Trema orientale]
MLTNVFKIGGLHQISWFQFLPHESDWTSLPDNSVKVEQKDAATTLVLSSHLQLQKEGFLSTWTNSFVGPWDPSQGLHNPGGIGVHDEKIKLWLFLPGHHSSVVESAQATVSRLRVVKFGLWLAPGDSEEVATALSQALRNCIERALYELSYMRFGDVFSKFRPSQSEETFRRGQHTVEFIFAATEEGIFVHAIISSKHIRALSCGDLERVAKQSSSNSSYKLPVIVSPHGIRGRLTGCCSDDLVKQLYFSSSKFKASNGFIGLPNHVSQGSGCQLGGQQCYVEVTLGCHRSGSDEQLHSNSNSNKNLPKHHVGESPALGIADQKGALDNMSILAAELDRTLIAWFSFLCALGSKRPRAGMTESFGQMGAATNFTVQDSYKSDLGSVEVSNSVITGVANEQIGSFWDWDDDDRDVGTDIRALLHEFGDFGDFFENDALPFGEPPGTAESQALMFSAPDCGDILSSPVGIMDVSDPLLSAEGFTSFDSFNPPPPAANDEIVSKNQGVINTSSSSGLVNHSLASSTTTSEFDHIIKAEALMTFAPEFGAVEAPSSELSSSIFRSPYFPKSRKVESSSSSSNNYVYGATPPSSPCFDGTDEKSGMLTNSKSCTIKQSSSGTVQSKNCYTLVENVKDQHDKRSSNNSVVTCDGMAASLSNVISVNATNSAQRKLPDSTFDSDSLFLSMKTVLATEIECIMYQASMCRIRHTLLSSSSPTSAGMGRLPSTILNQLPSDPSIMTDNLSGKFEVKKKESIPVRIAGDIDGRMLDGHLNAPVGVWRSVGAPRISKPTNSPNMEVSQSLPHNAFNEEGILSYGQRQPLQELLDGMALLVQQATSFVDLALDTECGDGPYGLLALQEQWRKGFSCGPSMAHAGCGGTLASCHSLDIAGVELIDPLSADVYASSVISLLQADIKTALKSAFDALDGPLSVTDWCRGRNQSGEAGNTGDGYSAESTLSESSSAAVSTGEPMSPSQTSGGPSGLKDGVKMDDTCQKRSNQENCSSEADLQMGSRLRPTLFVVPLPSILVGYQDDWLKTSANSLQFWEKAPFEPYALQKPITYGVVCPDIDPLTSAASDFFQQLGTVYETCKLGTHLPQSFGNQMEVDSGKCSTAGFVLFDCPQAMRIESGNASLVGSISDYFLSLSNGWDLTSYLKSLSKALKALKLGPCLSTNAKEGSSSSCMVIYVVCPFPEPTAVLQTVVESSVALGSVIFQSDRERRSILHSQVAKALSCSTAVDEASISNVSVLSGFSIPKLVLQIVTVDAIFRVTSPSLSELVTLKEIAFTVYNKARRMSRGSSNDVVQSSSLSTRSQLVLTQMSSHNPGMWKDCIGPRITGHSLPREGEIDSSLRPGAWDNSWQTRAGSLACDPNRMGDYFLHDEIRYMFEPLFILAEAGSLENGYTPFASGNIASESSKSLLDDSSGGYMQNASSAGSGDSASNSHIDGSDMDKASPSLHCCYGWTEDWRWLVCIWTDARGELLDSQIFPFGGISSRQDTKGLECLFVQVLQQGCQILQACSSDTGVARPRDFVIARIGSFYELEYQEWQKAINSVGGSEVKKWSLQLRRSVSDGIPANSNGTSLQQQEMSLIQDRNLPSSPSPLYSSPHSKTSGFMKGGLGQPAARKHIMSGHTVIDSSKGLLQWVQSITFAAISVDHSLHLVSQADSSSPGGTQGSLYTGPSGYLEGFTPVKSLGSTSASYILIPSPSMRFLPPTPLQLPTCLTAESPPLAHLLHSKGSAIPLSTGFVISKAVPSMRKDSRNNLKEEWPSALSISLIDHYGGNNFSQEKIVRGLIKQGRRSSSSEPREFEIETHLILESVAAELQALSWMTVSPAYLERRTALPFHCDMVLRLRRLLHFADKELSRHPEKSQTMG